MGVVKMKRKVVNVKRMNKNTKTKILLKITASLIGLGVIVSSYGLYQYKIGFGSDIIEYYPNVDLVLNKFIYKLINFNKTKK